MNLLSAIHLEMLSEIGIDVSGMEIERNIAEQSTECVLECKCDNPWFEKNMTEGQYWCTNCGLCVYNQILVYNKPYAKDGQRYGCNDTMTITKKRYYKPETHFREHIRRYFGHRLFPIPPEIITDIANDPKINIKDRYAYFAVRNHLKSIKRPDLYREIFAIIYDAGGIMPDLSPQVLQGCIASFKALAYKFALTRRNKSTARHNMPSLYMCLDMLLRRYGHEPHYHLPVLKNESLRKNVYHTYNLLLDNEFA